MVKLLLKWLLPDAKTISDMFAETAAKAINDSGKADKIALYTSYVEKWDKIQGIIINWLNDGKIDDEEKAQMSKAIEPIVQKILDEVKK